EADGGGLHLQRWFAPPRPAARIALAREGRGASARRPLPAGAARGSGDMGEGVGALGPLGAPQALAAGHRGLFLSVRLGQFGKEAAGDGAGPLPVDAAVRRMEDGTFASSARDCDVREPPFLFE